MRTTQNAFIPLEKTADFNRRSSFEASGGLKPPSAPLEKLFLTGSAQTVKERNFLTGFTLMELMMVVVIFTIMAAFAIPNFRKAVSRQEERGNYLKLRTIMGAFEIYTAKGNVLAGNLPDINAINAAFNVQILPSDGFTYTCQPDGAGVLCTATSPEGWMLHFHPPNNVVHCETAPCPSCVDEGAGDCPY